MPDAERFWSKVNKTETCWLWTASLTRGGYGSFRVTVAPRMTVTVYAHRWSYKQAVGPIPAGMQLDHLCRARNCVRSYSGDNLILARNGTRRECRTCENARQRERAQRRRQAV